MKPIARILTVILALPFVAMTTLLALPILVIQSLSALALLCLAWAITGEKFWQSWIDAEK